MLGTMFKRAMSQRLTLIFAVLATPGAALAQEFVVDELSTPSFNEAPTSAGYFHQVSAPEVIARPAAQSTPFPNPTPAGPGTYSGVVPIEPPLKIGAENLNCCPGERPGEECQVDRYFKKPTHLSKEELECVVCLKEPYTVDEPVTEQVEAVIYRCFKTKAPFAYSGCEDGTCFYKKGEKELRRMRPCTVKVNLTYDKKVVKYRDVWYHVKCPPTP